MKEFIKNPFIRFILLFTVLTVVWFSLYKYIYILDGSNISQVDNSGINKSITIVLANTAGFFTNLIGYTSLTEVTQDLVIVRLTDFQFSHGTWIGEPCNGLKVMGLFALFVIAFPGKHLHKWWFILAGMVIIHITNALRVSALTIIEAKWPQYLDFNHNVTFQVLIYGVIFLMWYLWVQKFSGLNTKKSNFQ